MSRWEGPIDFEKYYGERKYKEIQSQIKKIEYSKNGKQKMLKEIISYIQEKDFKLYHDFMDDICESHQDWFNMITFSRNEKRCILEYIKSSAIAPYR